MADNELFDFEIENDDFKLVQHNVKIADVKFETKPTTYLKDAFRRFRKNKSSVVAAIVLGFLILLAIFGPIFSPYDTKTIKLSENFLQPKLFEAGTGFWDGTTKKKNIIYDKENERVASFYAPAISNLVVDKSPTYVDKASPYGKGGYCLFINDDMSFLESEYNIFTHSKKVTFTANGNYKAEIKLFNENNINNNVLGEYQVVLQYGENQILVLKDWSKDYTSYTLDISAALQRESLNNITGALAFYLKPAENVSTYILIEQCILTSNIKSAEEELKEVSILDATKTVSYAKDPETQKFPNGYWSCTGIKNVYKSEVYYCSFTYDTYKAVYDTREMAISYSDLTSYAEKGYCSFDSNNLLESFVVLDEKCPIESIVSYSIDRFGNPTNIITKGTMYKYLGYESMPKYLFGTDQYGRDMFTKAFSGLRTSLLLGVLTASFCLLFGLCWGAISGYFGGNIDLAMERFCDILGNIPTIVVLTLAILHLGNNLFTFFLALCVTGWMGTAARTRTQFYRFKGREYVLASRTLGASDMRLIFRHILPNALGTIVTGAVLMIPSVIYSEASIAYLNLGLQGVDSFGVLLSENQQFLGVYPYLVVFPAVIIALLMISFNLFGNGLRDALNPSLKGSD